MVFKRTFLSAPIQVPSGILRMFRFCTPNRSHRFDSMFPCATYHLLKHIETDFSETGMFAMFAVILSYVVIVMKPVISTGSHTRTDMRWLSANGTGSL